MAPARRDGDSGEARCIALWSELSHPEQKDRTIAEVWAEERPQANMIRYDSLREKCHAA